MNYNDLNSQIVTDARLLKFAEKQTDPVYLYSSDYLRNRIRSVLGKGVIVRYAIKANPHVEIVKLFNAEGAHFDASSSFEAEYLLKKGIEGNKIRLSSQQPPSNLRKLYRAGVKFTATSMYQIEVAAKVLPRGSLIGVRINPGFGSGEDMRRNTAGVDSSFGIWHEYIPALKELCVHHGIRIDTVHIHVGSGADPAIWKKVIKNALGIMKLFPDASTLDIGGGYKIARFKGEKETDLPMIINLFLKEVKIFNTNHKRSLSLEVEPGTWLVGHAGILLSRVVDVVDTGKHGFTFAKLNIGMNDILRPTLYGAQHLIRVLNKSTQKKKVVFVGHNCETGDILTPMKGNPNTLSARLVNSPVIGDIVAIYDVGAYCASMRAHGYNAYPSAKELWL